ncbi:PREDICTED: uncharacterized protein K02A2.6-like [Cyphomyrmex costatus]|uniref:uncharacterized protein K02A2.6-like n=1 Tax=Cyphomyrmex costatus TaxID=456900 RepID=UPI0008523F6F|nr:PREDICTED: uncharacterized protein K02A2.6-like [Cyphomyrmex costatus]
MVDAGILEKVEMSRWATPIVPVLKKDSGIRICGDFSVSVNPSLIVDKHPLPTIEELFASMSGGTIFSQIDLKQAYLQLPVEETDREILTLSMHKGLFKCNRLMYGVASAPAIWQRTMENIFSGIPGVAVFLDDIRIAGKDLEQHLERLESVLKRLSEHNIRINVEKVKYNIKKLIVTLPITILTIMPYQHIFITNILITDTFLTDTFITHILILTFPPPLTLPPPR